MFSFPIIIFQGPKRSVPATTFSYNLLDEWYRMGTQWQRGNVFVFLSKHLVAKHFDSQPCIEEIPYVEVEVGGGGGGGGVCPQTVMGCYMGGSVGQSDLFICYVLIERSLTRTGIGSGTFS